MSIKVQDRISILKDKGLFSLVIFPVRDKLKLWLLFGWLILWSGCGMIFIAYLINFSNGPKYAEMEYIKVQKEITDKAEKEKAIEQIKIKLEKNQTQRMILIVIIGFWAYYEFKVGRAYFFRKYGYEKIWIKKDKLHYKKEFGGRGKTKVFDINYIKSLKKVDYFENDFFQNMSRSFWTLSGESVEFSYHSKTMRFGIQLSEKESEKVVKEIDLALKKI